MESIENFGSCGICGSFTVEIRGRYAHDKVTDSIKRTQSRIVCPTCLADRMDQIRQVSDPDYGVAFKDATEPQP